VSAHTPAPWRAVVGKGYASVKGPDCAIYINLRTVETDDCVARWQADARLIAAAPDLLDALRAFVAEAECYHSTCHDKEGASNCDSICAALPAGRAAIAKAEWRS
jgi:hypothetical protein